MWMCSCAGSFIFSIAFVPKVFVCFENNRGARSEGNRSDVMLTPNLCKKGEKQTKIYTKWQS